MPAKKKAKKKKKNRPNIFNVFRAHDIIRKRKAKMEKDLIHNPGGK